MAVSTVIENQVSRFPILNGNLNWLFVAFYPIMLCPGGSRNIDPEMAHYQHGKPGTVNSLFQILIASFFIWISYKFLRIRRYLLSQFLLSTVRHLRLHVTIFIKQINHSIYGYFCINRHRPALLQIKIIGILVDHFESSI